MLEPVEGEEPEAAEEPVAEEPRPRPVAEGRRPAADEPEAGEAEPEAAAEEPAADEPEAEADAPEAEAEAGRRAESDTETPALLSNAGVPFVGLTGGMGAGKSTALAALESLGAATLSTDGVVHELYASDEVRDAVVARWGEEVAPDGTVDRRAVAGKAFASTTSATGSRACCGRASARGSPPGARR